MAKRFKNLNSDEKYNFLFRVKKKCAACGKTKTNNCFFDRKNQKILKTCKICRNRKEKEAQESEVIQVLLGAIEQGTLKL